MLRMPKRLFLFGLVVLIVGSILTAPLTARSSETNGLSEVRIARLAKGINIPGWLWLNRGPVDELRKRWQVSNQFPFQPALPRLRDHPRSSW